VEGEEDRRGFRLTLAERARVSLAITCLHPRVVQV
jgi:hypothetical protein